MERSWTVAITKRVIAAQRGPVGLVGHSYGDAQPIFMARLLPPLKSPRTRRRGLRRDACPHHRDCQCR